MSIVVEHEKRKREILEKSLQLFTEDGYEDVTFQKIADKCGITRTTLYIYFKNKREIFLWSIKLLTGGLEKELGEIIRSTEFDSAECLGRMMKKILDISEENREFFRVLKMYLMQLEKSGVDVNERVTRRVIKIRHLLSMVIIRGQKKGEIKKVPVRQLDSLFYGILETSAFHLGVLNKNDLDESRKLVDFLVEEFREKK